MKAVEVPRVFVTTPPSARPVTLSRARDHLNITDTDRDTKLGEFIDAAVDQMQEETGRALCTQGRTLYRDDFSDEIELPGGPLQSVTAVKYTPLATGVELTVPSSHYRVDTASEPGRIVWKDEYDPPSDDLIEVNGVKVEYVCGYGQAAEVASTVTMTIAAPGVVSWTAHGRSDGDAIVLSTTGALPTGLTAGAVYYVTGKTTNTFSLATSRGGSAITTTGTQSGVHTATLVDGRPASMPHKLVQALLLLIGHWNNNREATTDQSAGNVSPTPIGYDRIVAQHRLGVIV